MNKAEATRMTSPCGLPCFHCPVNMAIDNAEIRSQVAAVLGISEEKAVCQGCRAQEGRIPVLNAEQTCKIYTCNQEKGTDFCHECDDFPCDRLHPYADQAQFPHNTKMFQLCMMKKLGVEKWAAEKAGEIWNTYRTEKFDFGKILY